VGSMVDWEGDETERSYFSNAEFKEAKLPPRLNPHIDKSWHKPFLLEELSSKEKKEFNHNLTQATLNALIYDLLKIQRKGSSVEISRYFPGERIVSRFLHPKHHSLIIHLYDFIKENPGLINNIFKLKNTQDEQDFRKYKEFDRFHFDQGFRKLKPLIIDEMINEAGDQDAQEIYLQMFVLLFSEFKSMIKHFFSGNEKEKEKEWNNHRDHHLKDEHLKRLREKELKLWEEIFVRLELKVPNKNGN